MITPVGRTVSVMHGSWTDLLTVFVCVVWLGGETAVEWPDKSGHQLS